MSRTPDRFFSGAVLGVAGMAVAFADRSQAAMCVALMDGRAWAVGELGSYAGAARSAASEHVDVPKAYGLTIRIRQGQHCYVTISGLEAARVVEALGATSASVLLTAYSPNTWAINKRLLAARACYRHLVGRLDVSLAKHLQERGHLDPPWQPTDSEGDLLATWGLGKSCRTHGEACMDSTERQSHFSGPLRTALTRALLGRAWITRIGQSRVVKVTTADREALTRAGLADMLTLLDETTSNNATG